MSGMRKKVPGTTLYKRPTLPGTERSHPTHPLSYATGSDFVFQWIYEICSRNLLTGDSVKRLLPQIAFREFLGTVAL